MPSKQSKKKNGKSPSSQIARAKQPRPAQRLVNTSQATLPQPIDTTRALAVCAAEHAAARLAPFEYVGAPPCSLRTGSSSNVIVLPKCKRFLFAAGDSVAFLAFNPYRGLAEDNVSVMTTKDTYAGTSIDLTNVGNCNSEVLTGAFATASDLKTPGAVGFVAGRVVGAAIRIATLGPPLNNAGLVMGRFCVGDTSSTLGPFDIIIDTQDILSDCTNNQQPLVAGHWYSMNWSPSDRNESDFVNHTYHDATAALGTLGAQMFLAVRGAARGTVFVAEVKLFAEYHSLTKMVGAARPTAVYDPAPQTIDALISANRTEVHSSEESLLSSPAVNATINTIYNAAQNGLTSTVQNIISGGVGVGAAYLAGRAGRQQLAIRN